MSAPDFPKGVSAPATRALTGAGYTELGQLAGASAEELRKLHGMGPKAIRVIQAALEEQGSSLDMPTSRDKEAAWAAAESALSADDTPGSSIADILDDLARDRR